MRACVYCRRLNTNRECAACDACRFRPLLSFVPPAPPEAAQEPAPAHKGPQAADLMPTPAPALHPRFPGVQDIHVWQDRQGQPDVSEVS